MMLADTIHPVYSMVIIIGSDHCRYVIPFTKLHHLSHQSSQQVIWSLHRTLVKRICSMEINVLSFSPSTTKKFNRSTQKSKRFNFLQWLQSRWNNTARKSTIFTRILCAQSGNQWNCSCPICKWCSWCCCKTFYRPNFNNKNPFLYFSHERFEREFVYQQRAHWMMLNTWPCYHSAHCQHATLKLFRFSRQQKIHITFGMIVHL